MKKILLFLLPLAAFGQAVRVDPLPVFTIAGNTPPGAFAPVLAIPGVTIKLFTTSAASTRATTYTDGTGGTACPTSAQVVLAGTTACVATTDGQGNFGFWLLSSSCPTNNTCWYTETLPNTTVFGPFPVTLGGGGGGGGGSPGGADTNVQYNLAGSFGGDGNLIWNHSSQILGVSGNGISQAAIYAKTGYVLSDGGFDANPSTATSFLSIQATAGGVGSAGVYVAKSTTGNVGGYFHVIPIPYANFPAVLTSDSFASTDVIMWAGGINGTVTPLTTVALNTNAFVDAAGGFASALTNWNTFQAPSGGMGANSFTAATYIQSGSFTGAAPTPSFGDTLVHGALAWSITNSCEKVFDGTSWTCLASGGGTSPGGLDTYVQVNNAGSFGGFSDFTYNHSTTTLTVTAGSSGGIASTGSSTATINAPNGGVTALSLRTTDSVFWVQESAPPISIAGQSKIYMDSTAHVLEVSQNGGAFAPLATAAAPGVTTEVIYNNAGAFGADAGFTWNVGTGILSLSGASGGFATSSTSTAAINIPSGGSTAKWHITTDSAFWIQEAAPPLSVAGQSKIYMDSTTHTLLVSQNGGAFTALGGSSTPPAGVSTEVQYNDGGIFGADAGLTWNKTTQILSVATTTGGIATTGTSTATINAPNGGSTAKWHISTDSYFWIQESAPPLSVAGQSRMYMDSTTHTLLLSQNGSAYSGLASTVNGISGAVTLAGTANEIILTPVGSTITFSTPQPIGTSSAVNFSAVTTTGTHQSTVAAGSGTAFNISNSLGGPFIVNGNGDISGNGSVNMAAATGLGAYRVNGSVIVDASRNATFATVTSAGTLQSTVAAGAGTAFNITNGLGSPFIVNGNGDISGNGSVNMNGATSLGAYRVGGTVVIDASRNLLNIAGVTFPNATVVNWTSGSTIINSAVVSSANVTGTNMGAGALSVTSSITVNGNTGVTGSTCSHWRLGVCDVP